MSTKERRERQKQATFDGILSAARQIARADGWQAVTIRRVAEMIEYTPPIVYEYFPSKNALLGELQRQGFALLAGQMIQARSIEGDGGGDALESILRMVDAYWRFAREQSDLYQLMDGWSSASLPLDKTLAGATQVAEVAQSCLEEWAAGQGVRLPDPEGAVDVLWALLHGLVTVDMMGRLGGGNERVRHLARETVTDLLSAWSAKYAAQ